jgi:hypothetical protein
MWNDFPSFLTCIFYIFSIFTPGKQPYFEISEMTTHTPCARGIWWTLDFASAFLSPCVNSRAELVPSPRAYARKGAPRRWLGNIEDMGSLRIGAQVLRSQLGISSGPVDFCVLIWDSSYSSCWDVIVNSSGTKRIGNLVKLSGGISFETSYMSNTYARCPMEKSKGHWTFHLSNGSNGSNGSPIFHWTFACPLDPMDKCNVHWPAMDQSELCINRIRDHVKVADRNNASTG